MRRLRVALALLAIGIAIPVWLLISRALEGLAFERAVRHEAVASRIFDEMESALSRLLEREEARAFEDYRFEEGAPLPSNEPFVLAYFQIEPDGRFRALAGAAATTVEGGERNASEAELTHRYRERLEQTFARRSSTHATSDALAKLEGKIAATPTAPRAAKSDDQRDDADRFEDDVLRQRQQQPRGVQKKSRPEAAPSPLPERASTAYEVLENLNIAQERRAARKQKVVVRPRSELYSAADEKAATQSEMLAEAITPSEARANQEEAAPSALLGDQPRAASEALGEASATALRSAPSSRVARALDALGSRSGADAETDLAARTAQSAQTARTAQRGRASAAAKETVRLAIDPMVGRSLPGDDGTVVLYRTVLLDRQGYRQGLLLDLDQLGSWLDAQVLAERGLSGVADAQFTHGRASAAPPRDGLLRFDHGFGEPFDALSVVLDLAPLPGLASATAIYGLSAMVVVVALAGLFAVYRMVSVVVRFAERRSNFVAAVSHELKTPLTAIRMYAEMLRDGLAPTQEKRDEYARTITDESERLTRLINNVLEFSQLEKGQRQVSLVVGPVGPVLAEVAEKLRPHTKSAGFTLTLNVAEGLPAVRFDRDALLQVLFNLVDNAMKYARSADRKEVTLDARKEGSRVEVCVRDFGPGVPGAHVRHVFEPFYRGESELTRTTKGTGIGLALVRELAERMGAKVSGDNAEGGGFRVRLAFEAAS